MLNRPDSSISRFSPSFVCNIRNVSGSPIIKTEKEVYAQKSSCDSAMLKM